MRAIVVVVAALLASACTGQAVVPSVAVEIPAGQKPVAGNYAATIQTGGWALRTKSRGTSCGVWTFDTDVNSSYEGAIRDGLMRSLEKVTFTPEILSPEQLKESGYDAQVVVHQGNASSTFMLSPKFFSASARGEVVLSVILAIRDGSGVTYQNTVTGKGSGSKEVFACPAIGQAVGAGAQDAVRTIVREIVLSVRDGLRDRRVAAKPQS
ncbi:MAG: hypothetical protein ACM30I_02080 [Gemmatimonas sp.]